MMGATTLSSPTANKSLNGAKKTITDFFGKSPSKSPLGEVKHKDLLDYFSKPSCGKNTKNNGLLVEEFSPSTKFPKKIATVNNIENSINAKNKKRKYNGKELTVSNNNHDINGVKRKKRKSNGFLEEKASSSLIISKINQSNNKSAKTADVQENAEKVEGKSVQHTRPKPKCPDGKAKSYKPLVFGASNLKTIDSDLASPLSNDVDINSSKALELSYEEFLQSQETESENLEDETQLNEDEGGEEAEDEGGEEAEDEGGEEAEDEGGEESGDEGGEESGDEESEESGDGESEESGDGESEESEDEKSEESEGDKEPEDDFAASPCPKSKKSFSIATFFSPIPKPPPKKENSDFQKLTVLADIHPEPRQKPSSPKQTPTQPKSGEIVLKTISRNAKSKITEADGIVLLSTEHHSDAEAVPAPSDGTKQKSFKKTISSAERAPKKSAKKDSSSNVGEEKSSQSLLNFSGHKLSSSKVQDEVSIIEDTHSSQTVSNQKTKGQTDVRVKEYDSDVVQETLKKKRGRPRKISKKESENIAQVVNKEEKPATNRKRQIDSKELQTANDKDIVNAETSIPKKKERNSGKISKAEQENIDGYSTQKNGNDDLEKKTWVSDPALKLNKKTPKTPENTPILLGTRRSARLRDHKAVSPPSPPQEVQTPTTISKTRKEKKKPNSCSSEKSKESCTGKESQTKQADSGKLASIFLKKKDKEKAAAAASVIDEEALKLRRAFLMGGLTDEAKKQKQANALLSSSIVTADYPPLPSENHIQQKPLLKEDQNRSNLNVWNLPEVTLPRLTVSDDNFEVCSLRIPEWKSPSSLLRIHEDKRNRSHSIKPFSGHIPLSENDVSSAIKDLSAANPSYPVQRFYDMAKAKGKNSLKAEGEDTTKSVENQKACEPQVVEKPKRRSLGRRKAAQAALNQDVHKESTEKEKIDSSLEDKACDILWTEKYQPQHSTEVISNCGNLKKLKSWLLEWKQQTDKEIRKLRKMLIKQRKHKKSKGEDSSSSSSWLDDDDVFEGSSSESDDDSLCNTMLLSGPHGVGKTSAIYALAAELGYQVFEVNASSARTGKKIQLQLQEATQSHQVSKENAERSTPVNVGLMNNLNSQNKVAETSQKKLASSTSFANFFKSSKNVKPDPVSNSKENKKEASKGKKKQTSLNLLKGAKSGKVLTLKSKPDVTEMDSNCDLESASDKIKQRVNISSTSLILFDEVDVVLEEDKGFWAAIQNFMLSTKRPIILTASSADIAEQFGSSCEHLSFRNPSTKVITSHLQTLCLAENVLTDSSGISSLVDYFDADMRACLLNLQFWINSGGDLNKCAAPIGSKSKPKKKGSKTAKTADSKNENHLTHENCLESCLGLNPQNVKSFFNDDLIKAESETISWEDLTPICFHGYQRHFSLLHQLFVSKLPLPQKFFPPLPNRVQLLQTARKKVTNNNNPSRMFDSVLDTGLYESESSSLDDFLTIPKPKEKEDKMDMSSQPVSCSQESEASYSTSQPVDPQMEGLPSEENIKSISELSPEDLCRQRNCENKILNNLAKFYECCSYTDMFSTSCGYTVPVGSSCLSSTLGRSTVTSGLCDELPMEESYSQGVHWCAESTVNLVTHLELRTYVTCQRNIFQASKNVVSGHEHSISVAPQRRCYGLASLQPHDQSRVVNQQRAVENVLSNIPLSSGFQQNSLHLDYLPILRDVCRTEKTRQQAKLKRRFFHYFDNISFPLRESTLNVLATGFT